MVTGEYPFTYYFYILAYLIPSSFALVTSTLLFAICVIFIHVNIEIFGRFSFNVGVKDGFDGKRESVSSIDFRFTNETTGAPVVSLDLRTPGY